jgi:hypothetical protein
MTDYLYDLPNATSGIDAIAVQTIENVPSLAPLLLVFVWFVVFLGGVIRQNGRNGSADYPAWSVAASLSTFLAALIMSVASGFINLDILVVTIVITIFSFVWLALDKRGNEM